MVRALDALAEDHGSVSSTLASYNHVTPVPGDPGPPAGLHWYYTHKDTHTYNQAYTYTLNVYKTYL